MNLKELLTKLKKQLLDAKNEKNEENEFAAVYEDHKIADSNVYRLRYINYHNIGESYGYKDYRGVIDWPFEKFYLPENMNREDAFKVLSYLTDWIESNTDTKICSYKSVKVLNHVLDMKRYGFSRVNEEVAEEDVIDLFTVSGRVKRFIDSKYYDRYFEWYTPNVPREEVVAIYEKCGLTFEDLVSVSTKAKKLRK